MSIETEHPEAPDENTGEPEENQAPDEASHQEHSQVEESAVPSSVAEPVKHPQESVGRKLWRMAVFIFNVVLIILLVSVIGAGLYFGWPVVYDKYILPVQNHTAQIDQLEKGQEQTNLQVSVLQGMLSFQLTEQAGQAGGVTELGAKVDGLATEVSTHNSSLAALEAIQKELQADKQNTNSEINRQVNLLRAIELLSRARLFLYQSNFGLAKQDVQTARNIISTVQTTAANSQVKELAEVLQHLDLCLIRLPDFPVTASDDLDIAWQILLGGVPQPASLPEIGTPTVTPEFTSTPTLEVSPTVTITTTPVLVGTITITVTPMLNVTVTTTPTP